MNLPADAATDQSNCPPDYYRRNNGMLHQIPACNAIQPNEPSLSASDIARLEQMTREELLEIMQKCIAAAGWINLGLLTEIEIKSVLRLQLLDMGVRSKDDKVKLSAINQLLDRIEGKPMGSANQIMIASPSDISIRIVLVGNDDAPKESIKVIDN